MSDDVYEVRPNGRVESSLTDPALAPKQGPEGSPDAWLALDPEVAEGVADIASGDRLIVLTWLHCARRNVPRVHPRDVPRSSLPSPSPHPSSPRNTRHHPQRTIARHRPGARLPGLRVSRSPSFARGGDPGLGSRSRRPEGETCPS